MRESGFYWVRDDEGWCVAYFYKASGYYGWRATNCEVDFYDDDWLEIDERRIERAEP